MVWQSKVQLRIIIKNKYIIAAIYFNCLTGIDIFSQSISLEDKHLTQKQFEFISSYLLQFPENSQMSIGIIDDKNVNFKGVKKENGKIINIDNKDSVFEIGSISKIFTSSILATLAFNKILNIDDPIEGILPYKLHQSSLKDKPITFKSLANYTSGLAYEPDNIDISINKNPTNPYLNYNYELLNDYLQNRVTLNSIPGEKFEYSNLGAGLLGYLLEIKTGEDYETLLQEKIFSKYNMSNSSSKFNAVETLVVKGLDTCGRILPYWNCNALKASGGVLSSANDLSKFVIANFSEDTILNIQRQVTYNNMNFSVALGWEVIEIGGAGCSMKWYYKTGDMGGYTSVVLMDTYAHYGVVILSNISCYHKKANAMQLGVDILKQMYITGTKEKLGHCIAPFLELALANGWGTFINDSIKRGNYSDTSIIGVWQKQTPYKSSTRTFMPDGKVQSDFMGDPEIDVWGFYKIKNNQIEFEDVGGNACKSEGSYKYWIKNDTLQFHIINDTCDGRSQGLSGIWTRKM